MPDSNPRRLLIAALWLLTAVIGGLQMAHINAGLLTAQGADVVAPALLYVITRDGKSLLRFVGLRPDRSWLVGGGIFLLSAGWEFCQRAAIIPGIFDPADLVAYALGIGGAMIADVALSPPTP